MKNNHRGFAPILLILLTVAVISGGTYFYSKTNKVSQTTNDSNSETGNIDLETNISDLKNSDFDNTYSDEENQISNKKTISSESDQTSATSIKANVETSLSNVEKPDLTIEDIKIYESSSPKEIGGYQRLTVRICNRGKVGINTGNLTKLPEKISISFTLDGKTDYSRRSAPSILPGNCDLEGFQFVDVNQSYGIFKGIKTGTYLVSAKVDAGTSKVDESNENNNIFSKNIYLNFDQTISKIIFTSPQSGAIWNEGEEYVINWQPLSNEVVRYYVSVGNYGSQTSMGLSDTYSQAGIGNQTSLTYKIKDGFVNSMFMGDSKGKTVSGIKNDFYFEVTATNSKGEHIGYGRSDTFTIEP